MSWANVNWDEVKAKYEEGTYTYQRLAEEYGVSIQTVCSHAVKGQWQRGREEAEKRSWAAVTRYARRRLRVVPDVVSSLYCTTNPGLDDGIHVVSAGPVTALYGENLMKFAPLLGELVEQALVG